ncbi:hypothetical protein, partial [Pseudomonas quasicaspiana]|uniref:hypothetical protein n=1 Tax=Pseudomonas quasicaspiana TaxID=2829821 RepID=UPI001E4A0FBB
GVGEGHLFHHRKARRLVFRDFAKSGSLFQSFLRDLQWNDRLALECVSLARFGQLGANIGAQVLSIAVLGFDMIGYQTRMER